MALSDARMSGCWAYDILEKAHRKPCLLALD